MDVLGNGSEAGGDQLKSRGNLGASQVEPSADNSKKVRMKGSQRKKKRVWGEVKGIEREGGGAVSSRRGRKRVTRGSDLFPEHYGS